MPTTGPPKKLPIKEYNKSLASFERKAFLHNLQIYIPDLFPLYSQLQTNDLPDPNMIDSQPELKWYMRPYLVDFLIELHNSFHLKQDTLYLALHICDRYCSKRIVYSKHLQLVVATSLWIASKYQDKKLRIPALKELCLLCKNNYDTKIFIQMESHILTTLNWEIGHTITLEEVLQCCFFNFDIHNDLNISNIQNNNTSLIVEKVVGLYQLSSFLCELTMYSKQFMYFSNTIKASVATLISSRILNLDSVEIYNTLFTNDTSNNHILAPLFGSPLDLDTFRKCCHCFLNEIFQPYMCNMDETGNPPKIYRSLRKKYKFIQITTLLSDFTRKNIDFYLKLSYLSEQDLTNTFIIRDIIAITDYFLNLPPQQQYNRGNRKLIDEVGYDYYNYNNYFYECQDTDNSVYSMQYNQTFNANTTTPIVENIGPNISGIDSNSTEYDDPECYEDEQIFESPEQEDLTNSTYNTINNNMKTSVSNITAAINNAATTTTTAAAAAAAAATIGDMHITVNNMCNVTDGLTPPTPLSDCYSLYNTTNNSSSSSSSISNTNNNTLMRYLIAKNNFNPV
ncbi:cyclin family protein SCDLUD_003888 [Saccharomycodes ludwigii]|uniref:cyclin family protein n=1 Tax=Saccharomycodes ludwigii TaxID=36035 RepID=UPI001E86D734|nr:hypothetical protein SCDLUD_003888 [Saccharomycodes ludwigii]KAH3899608.1 hypothetical protein SCDLUD_003888 [Saccharomycodes ludwigii]